MTDPMADLIDCAALRDHVETLSVSLAHWADHDDTKPQPEVRRAANRAVESIDAALRELHRIRDRLTVQIRQSDDAAMARTEALLREIPGEKQ